MCPLISLKYFIIFQNITLNQWETVAVKCRSRGDELMENYANFIFLFFLSFLPYIPFPPPPFLLPLTSLLPSTFSFSFFLLLLAFLFLSSWRSGCKFTYLTNKTLHKQANNSCKQSLGCQEDKETTQEEGL